MSKLAYSARSASHQGMGMPSTYNRTIAEPKSVEQFPYGWRYVIETLPNGEETYSEVPLTAEDFLDPQLGDQMIQSAKHFRTNIDLFNIFDKCYANDPTVKVFGDLKMIWGIPGLKEPAPDVAVVPNIKDKDAEPSSFEVLKEGTRPCLIIEIMSPNYPGDDTTKVNVYEQAGVAEYIIINPHSDKTRPFYEIFGYRLKNGKYRAIKPDNKGRLLSQTTGVLFSLHRKKRVLKLFDAHTGKRLLTALETDAALSKSEKRTQDAEKRAQAEAAMRLDAEKQVQAEAVMRQALEKRIQELESQIK